MERRRESILATRAVSVLALTLIAPWVPGQDPITEIRRQAEPGSAGAQQVLLAWHYRGRGVPQDYGETVRGFWLAAGQGEAEAQSNPGFIHDNGEGVPENDAESVQWFRPAAVEGHPRTPHNLGLMYANGDGVPPDDVLTYAGLSRAAAHGNPLASANKDPLRARTAANQIARARELSATLFDRINWSAAIDHRLQSISGSRSRSGRGGSGGAEAGMGEPRPLAADRDFCTGPKEPTDHPL